jgi:hypothetical protein
MFRGSPLVVVYKMGSLIGVCQDQTNFLKTISYIWTAIVQSTNIQFYNPIAILTMSGPSTASIRRIVLTGSIAAITATGTWYGAGLKTQQERNQVSHDFFYTIRPLSSCQTGQTSNIGIRRFGSACTDGGLTRPACPQERRAAGED